MATINSRVCDRCGRELKGIVWYMKRPYLFPLWYRTCDPYDYGNYEYELCNQCGKEVRDFVRTAPKEEMQNESDI